MTKFTNVHCFIANTTSSHVKFLGLATLLLLLVGAKSSYFQRGSTSRPNTPADVPNNRKVVIATNRPPGVPPVLAYWIYGSTGDSQRMLRLLKATYHPRNQYLLLLDASSSHTERKNLALSIQSDPLFDDNVNVVGRSYGVNQMGGSGLAALLHASALLLKITSSNWDWFIPLSAAFDYPLYTQDGTYVICSSV
ncbi:beta-glucuronosyltransferase GlcAT14A-like protein [Tanacetum coccineum]